ncbi:UBAP1-MVB12-associated (UMA)-domain containing protein 1 isoform 4-T14 [Amazona ochrocephala]
MFSFFRKSQDSKKVTVPEREADGFVIVEFQEDVEKKEKEKGSDTIDDQSRESKDKTPFPETRPMYNQPSQDCVVVNNLDFFFFIWFIQYLLHVYQRGLFRVFLHMMYTYLLLLL